MAEAADVDVDDAPPRKKGKKGLLIGLLAMLLLGGGGFFATFSGMLNLPFGGGDAAEEAHEEPPEHAGDSVAVAFVEIPQMMVTLGPSARSRHLRLSATLEIEPGREEEVAKLMPRVKDVINSYMQALDEADVERPAAMTRMRAHLLRRIRIVAGEDAVRDLLITEFVLQ
ncbi:flagellar basal body-associated FliL family protein [Albimonas sp. CAU 1670]|uniref:flagellar basal body-associated FliL family protein n=1 Tax=Albimonas sp. CAU 1670 TaxID=3032599 RepID=UPI0023DAF462|nr:flagellar basal body-associated FliL family protein [Albimonas sp. CAU 1670]MDF2231224.1 flagellar basal body-associated FliL family protein [Albimonas sp. CAU 1670]